MAWFHIGAKRSPRGPLSQQGLVAYIAASAATLLAIDLATHSVWLSLLALYALVIPWGWMQRRAGRTRPFPPYPDPPPPKVGLFSGRFLLLLGALAIWSVPV